MDKQEERTVETPLEALVLLSDATSYVNTDRSGHILITKSLNILQEFILEHGENPKVNKEGENSTES